MMCLNNENTEQIIEILQNMIVSSMAMQEMYIIMLIMAMVPAVALLGLAIRDIKTS